MAATSLSTTDARAFLAALHDSSSTNLSDHSNLTGQTKQSRARAPARALQGTGVRAETSQRTAIILPTTKCRHAIPSPCASTAAAGHEAAPADAVRPRLHAARLHAGMPAQKAPSGLTPNAASATIPSAVWARLIPTARTVGAGHGDVRSSLDRPTGVPAQRVSGFGRAFTPPLPPGGNGAKDPMALGSG